MLTPNKATTSIEKPIVPVAILSFFSSEGFMIIK